MSELPQPLTQWHQHWRRAQDHLVGLEARLQAAALGLHLRAGLWLHGQAALQKGSGPWALPARRPAVVEETFPWSAEVEQSPPLPGWPPAGVLWRRIVSARILHPGPKLAAQVYLLLQLFRRAGVCVDELTWLRWHLLLEQAQALWLQRDEEFPREETELPWLFAPQPLPHNGATPRELLPTPGVSSCDCSPEETPDWGRRLAAAFQRWDQGDHGGQVVRDLLAGWADAQRRPRCGWTEEQHRHFGRIHRLLDGTRPWELLPRASAVLETETWPQRCEQLQQALLEGCEPAERIFHRAWQLLMALDDAELVLYAGRRLARINAQLAQRIEQQRLETLQRPGVLLAAWPRVRALAAAVAADLSHRDYELALTTVKFQALADHAAAVHWRLSFAEPATAALTE